MNLEKVCRLVSIYKSAYIVLFALSLGSCSSSENLQTYFTTNVTGKWILENDNSLMLDPQTSGLAYDDGFLYSVSDGSAHETQIQRLHKISAQDAQVTEKYGPIVFSEQAKNSCFVSYLSERPDYEAVVKLPSEENAWLLITEDATRAGEISEACQKRYSNTGSTTYPTLLVKVKLIDEQLVLVGVRAIQFDKNDNLGNFPNDGVEGLVLTRDNRLLLGVERDEVFQARVFELPYSNDLFEELDTFIPVKDAGLRFPKVDDGRHPINGMDVYYSINSNNEYLIAAARNDHQLWILDLAKRAPAVVVDVKFFAPSDTSEGCEDVHEIKNTALEGLAVHKETIYMINDPWKKVYPDNIVCEQDKDKYNNMSPLLFELPIDKKWLL